MGPSPPPPGPSVVNGPFSAFSLPQSLPPNVLLHRPEPTDSMRCPFEAVSWPVPKSPSPLKDAPILDVRFLTGSPLSVVGRRLVGTVACISPLSLSGLKPRLFIHFVQSDCAWMFRYRECVLPCMSLSIDCELTLTHLMIVFFPFMQVRSSTVNYSVEALNFYTIYYHYSQAHSFSSALSHSLS
jgi:hypothetical protein